MLYSISCPPGSALSGQYGPIGCITSPGGEFVSGSTVVITPVSLQPETLNPGTNFTDGALLGWGVVAAMVAAWAITILRRAL